MSNYSPGSTLGPRMRRPRYPFEEAGPVTENRVQEEYLREQVVSTGRHEPTGRDVVDQLRRNPLTSENREKRLVDNLLRKDEAIAELTQEVAKRRQIEDITHDTLKKVLECLEKGDFSALERIECPVSVHGSAGEEGEGYQEEPGLAMLKQVVGKSRGILLQMADRSDWCTCFRETFS